jgi:hypothetical protein
MMKWKEGLRPKIKKVLEFIFNPHFLLCFGIAWFFTNGWSYLALGLGTYLRLPWLQGVATAYLALLWVPFTPEKIITVMIAMWLLRWIYPEDKKTLAVLKELHERYRERHRARKEKRAAARAKAEPLPPVPPEEGEAPAPEE